MHNVVLIVLDDCPSDWNDYIPYVTGQPSGNWVYFPNSHNTMPQCASCRSTLFTGQYTHRHGVTDNSVALGINHAGLDPTVLLGRQLQRAGYTTGLFGKYLNGYPWYNPVRLDVGQPANDLLYVPPGWNEWRSYRTNNGSGAYTDFRLIEKALDSETIVQGIYETGEYATDVLSDMAVQFVTDASEPFFCYIPHYAPHNVAVPATRHANLYDEIDPADRRAASWNETDMADKPAWIAALPTLDAGTITSYDAERKNMWRCLAAVEEGFEAVVDALTSRGVMNNTVIMWMNDNGHLLGEHRLKAKPSPFDDCSKMHLRVRYPGTAQGTNQSLIGNIDMAPTILDIAGARPAAPVDGMSFVPLLDGTLTADKWREHLMIEQLPVTTARSCYGVRSRDKKYIEWFEADPFETSFYDLSTDPHELSASSTDVSLRSALTRIRNEVGVVY